MKDVVIAAMPGEIEPARRLAVFLNIDIVEVKIHRFPDGESRVCAPRAATTTAVYCSLNDPNAKLVDLMLAASALRDQGADRLILVAPYLCYMRQDTAFHVGESVSQRVVGRFLAERFDKIITVEPHLHRIVSLEEMFGDAKATSLSAAPLLARVIMCDGESGRALIVGPDEESRMWTEEIARILKAPFTILEKERRGDRDVSVMLDPHALIGGRIAYLVDDIASTGNTLISASQALLQRGALRIEAIVVHALSRDDDVERLRSAGVAHFRSTDTIAHSSNAIAIAPLLATALKGETR